MFFLSNSAKIMIVGLFFLEFFLLDNDYKRSFFSSAAKVGYIFGKALWFMGDYAKPGGFIILCYHFLVKLWRTNVCSRCSRQGYSPSGFAVSQRHLPRQREARGAQDRKKCGKDIGSGRGKTLPYGRCGDGWKMRTVRDAGPYRRRAGRRAAGCCPYGVGGTADGRWPSLRVRRIT